MKFRFSLVLLVLKALLQTNSLSFGELLGELAAAIVNEALHDATNGIFARSQIPPHRFTYNLQDDPARVEDSEEEHRSFVDMGLNQTTYGIE